MTIEQLRELVKKASNIYMQLPDKHPALESAYDVWCLLEREMIRAESKEA